MSTRFGCREHGTWRTVRSGSSRRAVPIPVSIAQERARKACTSRRAAFPVIQRLKPGDGNGKGNGNGTGGHANGTN